MCVSFVWIWFVFHTLSQFTADNFYIYINPNLDQILFQWIWRFFFFSLYCPFERNVISFSSFWNNRISVFDSFRFIVILIINYDKIRSQITFIHPNILFEMAWWVGMIARISPILMWTVVNCERMTFFLSSHFRKLQLCNFITTIKSICVFVAFTRTRTLIETRSIFAWFFIH